MTIYASSGDNFIKFGGLLMQTGMMYGMMRDSMGCGGGFGNFGMMGMGCDNYGMGGYSTMGMGCGGSIFGGNYGMMGMGYSNYGMGGYSAMGMGGMYGGGYVDQMGVQMAYQRGEQDGLITRANIQAQKDEQNSQYIAGLQKQFDTLQDEIIKLEAAAAKLTENGKTDMAQAKKNEAHAKLAKAEEINKQIIEFKAKLTEQA